ncbi:MAG: metal-dependent transcriptional regulator [bacterium]
MANKKAVDRAGGPARALRAGGLGASAEDYLEAIHLAGRSGRSVRVTGLAARLGVSKPSVVSALVGLERRGLVRHERYGAVELTARGARAAERVYRRHRVLEEFLGEVLGVGKATAATDACAIEHVLSAETTRRLERLVEFVRGERGAELRARAGKGGRDAR